MWADGQRYLDALIDMPHGLSFYLDLVDAGAPEFPEESEAELAFVLDILAEISRNPAIAKVNKAHRKQFLKKLTQMVEAAKTRCELVAGTEVESVVFAIDMIATARDVSVAGMRHDQQVYEKNTRLLLKGLLRVPA